MKVPQIIQSPSAWATAPENLDNRWFLDGLCASEIHSQRSGNISVDDGPDHVVVYRTKQLCSLHCEIGARIINGESRPGQLFVVPFGLRGSFQLAGAHTTWIFYLSEKLLEDAFAGTPGCETADIRLRPTAFRLDPVIQTVLSPLIQEIKGQGKGRSPLIAALSKVLAVQLVRRYSDAVEDTRRTTQLSPHQLKTVLQYMEDHCCQLVPLGTLANLTKLSPHYFLRLFKESTGTTPHNYLLRKRIEKAKRMLLETEMGMVEVALETGFPNQSHFGTIFKKITGQTPKAWLQSEDAVNYKK